LAGPASLFEDKHPRWLLATLAGPASLLGSEGAPGTLATTGETEVAIVTNLLENKLDFLLRNYAFRMFGSKNEFALAMYYCLQMTLHVVTTCQ